MTKTVANFSPLRGKNVKVKAEYLLAIGQPDAAYSASSNYELLGGFWPSDPMCFVDFEDFAKFARYWLQSGTDLPADLYKDETIDSLDLQKFVEEWLCYCPYGWPLK